MRTRPYRVVQWATGAMGRSMLKGLIERPEFDVAGVYVHTPAKIGVDAGTLARTAPIGVPATGDPEEIMALDADCVLYAALPSSIFSGDPHADTHGDLETICSLLASGKNVITVTGLLDPHMHGPGLVRPLEEACAAGGTSVHGTGINPGFMSDLLPLTLTGLCRKVDHVYVRECADFAGHPSAPFVRELIGLGKPEEDYVRTLPVTRLVTRSLFGESGHLLVTALGHELEHLDIQHEYLLADEDFEIASGPIAKGSVAAVRWTLNSMVAGHPLVTSEYVHKADAERVGGWAAPGNAVRIKGRPSLSLSLDQDWASDGLVAAAAHALNAIPAVCSAGPGIRTFLDLPLITGRA